MAVTSEITRGNNTTYGVREQEMGLPELRWWGWCSQRGCPARLALRVLRRELHPAAPAALERVAKQTTVYKIDKDLLPSTGNSYSLSSNYLQWKRI